MHRTFRNAQAQISETKETTAFNRILLYQIAYEMVQIRFHLQFIHKMFFLLLLHQQEAK